MANKLDVVNKAMALLGEAPITDFTGDKGQAINTLYDLIKETFLTSARWRFATKKAAIAVDLTAPLNEWTYRHAMPTDLLMLIRIYNVGQWEVYEDWIYTNTSGIEVDYIYSSAEKDWPVYAEWALVNEVAYQLALSITNKLSIVDRLQVKARETLNQAMFKDAQSRPATSIRQKPFVQIRN